MSAPLPPCAGGDPQRQSCKVCGHRDGFDYRVPDDLWAAVVPPEYRHLVVCLNCFDDFAREKGIDYSAAVDALYFAGAVASLTFRRVAL